MSAKPNRELSRWLQLLDEAYSRPSWHGPNLRSSVRGVTAEAAAWRPGRGRHNIWELVLHAAYWKHTVRRRLCGDRRPFAEKGSNWFKRPQERSEKAWRRDLALLESEHQALRRALAGARRLPATPPQRRRWVRHLAGIAFHDIYHAGQIRLLRRMYSPR